MDDTEARNLVQGLDWMVVMARIEDMEKAANGILGCADDPRQDEARKIVDLITSVRRIYQRGWPPPAGTMDQLYMLCRVANMRVLEPSLAYAEKTQGRFREAAMDKNKQRKNEGDQRKAQWQADANKIWGRHPDWSKNAVATRIAATTGENANTIRRKITRK